MGFDDFDLRLGDVMRGERATLGISLLDVQRDIKINARYLAAVEDADLAAFETPGFIAGYIRSYSKHLGLNPDWAFQTFCAETGFALGDGMAAKAPSPARNPGLPSPSKPASSTRDPFAQSPLYAASKDRMPFDIDAGMLGSFAVLILLICALGYGGWSVLREIQKVDIAPVETALGSTAPDAALTEGPVADGAGEPPRSDRIDRLYLPEVLDVPVVVARDGPISSLDPREQGAYAALRPDRGPALAAAAPTESAAAESPEDDIPSAGASDPLADAVAAAVSNAVQVTESTPPEVVLFAREPVWVRVSAADGTVLLEKILNGGERYVLPQTEAPPTLRAGNSGALYFAVNGETLGPAGNGTSIARNVSLGAEDLAAAYGAVDLGADPELARLAELVTTPTSPPQD